MVPLPTIQSIKGAPKAKAVEDKSVLERLEKICSKKRLSLHMVSNPEADGTNSCFCSVGNGKGGSTSYQGDTIAKAAERALRGLGEEIRPGARSGVETASQEATGPLDPITF